MTTDEVLFAGRLLELLGIQTEGCAKAVITLEPYSLITVEATYQVLSAKEDGFDAIIKQYEIVAKSKGRDDSGVARDDASKKTFSDLWRKHVGRQVPHVISDEFARWVRANK